MKSKTKYIASDEEIIREFAKCGLPAVTAVEPLGGGEFNAACRVTAGDRDCVIKIAPPPAAPVLTYERDMMRAEVFWYDRMAAETAVRIPAILARDFSREIIGADCFIMEMIRGEPLWTLRGDPAAWERAQEEKLAMLAQIHGIRGEAFGYVQGSLYPTWYDAILHMAENLVRDCGALGRETPGGEKFLRLIRRHRETLLRAPCRMVNFDLWDSNVLCEDGGSLCWIDPERGFWGDPVADLIIPGEGPKAPLGRKARELALYNRHAAEPLRAGREECIRYAVAVAYLALVEDVEKYVRYEETEENYIRNTVDAADMYAMAFGVLEA